MRSRMLAGDRGGCAGCMLFRCPGFRPLTEAEKRPGTDDALPVEQLLIEPTVACDLDCPTACGRSFPKACRIATQRKTAFMPLDLFRRIVEGIDRPISRICLYNYGEPLLHRDFSVMGQMLRARCPSAHIWTSSNGTQLARARVRQGLLQSGLDDIIVSVDGATQKTYAAYRRGGNLDSILNGMRRLREERERAGLDGPRIIWRYILFSWNDSDQELARAEQLARDIGVDRFCYHLSDLPDLASKIYVPGTLAFERIRGRLFDPSANS